MRIRSAWLALLLAFTIMSGAQSALAADFCWKASYGRGVGKVPGDCTFDQQKQGLLCYPKCQDGYTGFVASCFQNCPAGFTDAGAICTKPAPYGRGVGYAWQIQDGFSNSGMLSRCQASEGRACEMWGAIAYPTCKAGFSPVGANICSPVCTGGMTDLGAACAKKSYTRETMLPQCAAGEVYDAGLCYPACKGSYKGVGPVCWGGCAGANPVECAAGCAKDQTACAANTGEMVISTLNSVVSMASFAFPGATGVISAAWKQGARAAIQAAGKAALTMGGTKLTQELVKTAVKKSSETAGVPIKDTTVNTWANVISTISEAGAGTASTTKTTSDIFDVIPVDTLDITGLAGVFKAYTHPVCPAPQ